MLSLAAHVSLWGAEFSTYSFGTARCTSDPRCDAQQRRLVSMRTESCFAVPGPQRPFCDISNAGVGVRFRRQTGLVVLNVSSSPFDPEPPSVAQLFRKAHIPAARAEASTVRASESSHGLG